MDRAETAGEQASMASMPLAIYAAPSEGGEEEEPGSQLSVTSAAPQGEGRTGGRAVREVVRDSAGARERIEAERFFGAAGMAQHHAYCSRHPVAPGQGIQASPDSFWDMSL